MYCDKFNIICIIEINGINRKIHAIILQPNKNSFFRIFTNIVHVILCLVSQIFNPSISKIQWWPKKILNPFITKYTKKFNFWKIGLHCVILKCHSNEGQQRKNQPQFCSGNNKKKSNISFLQSKRGFEVRTLNDSLTALFTNYTLWQIASSVQLVLSPSLVSKSVVFIYIEIWEKKYF